MEVEGEQIVEAGAVEQQPQGLSQEQVNRIVQERMSKAAEKARAEAEQKYMAEIEQLKSQSKSMGGMEQQDPEDIARQVEERIMRSMQEKQQQFEDDKRLEEVKGIANSYYSKLEQGKSLYDDFDSIMADFDPSAFPEIISLVAGMDNVAQVMYELNQNPSKLVTISGLAKQSPKMAQAQLNRISQSIAKNEMAQQAEGSAQPPLNHERSSVKAGADNGVKTVNDLRKMSFLRG